MQKIKKPYFFVLFVLLYVLHILFFVFKSFSGVFLISIEGLLILNFLGIFYAVCAAYTTSSNTRPLLVSMLIILYVTNLAIILFGYNNTLMTLRLDQPATLLEHAKVAVNLIPFSDLFAGITLRTAYLYAGYILLWVPTGVTIIFFLGHKNLSIFLISFALAFAVEALQFLTMLGNFDVTEIILYVMGAQLGKWLFICFQDSKLYRWLSTRDG